MKNDFLDLFSSQSVDYSKFRPTYPPALFEYLSKISPNQDLVWDCATGNGQAALALARHFKKVIATDPSQKQIENASPAPNIEYRVGSAEASGLSTESFDLITVAQAFHWLKQDLFFAETKRLLKPGGKLAFWCYELAEVNPAVDACVMKLYNGTLGAYWEPNRKLVEEGYQNVKVPFDEIKPPDFAMSASWSLKHFVGYLSTWSALQTYIKKNHSNPLEAIYPELKDLWGDDPKEVTWKLALRAFQI